MSSIKTPLQMLAHWEANFPDQVYLRQSTGTEWIEYSWKEVADRVRRLASFIQVQNYPMGSYIAIWSSNSADWYIVDLAIMLSGNASVPIYPAQDLETADYILKHSGAKMLFVGQFEQANNLHQILPEELPTVAMRGAKIACNYAVDTLISQTEANSAFPQRDLDDVCTIIYSSGTSGAPKGVMHTYRTVSETGPLLAQTYEHRVCNAAGDDRERLISYLPLSHAAERSLVEMTSLYINSCISISAGLDFFGAEMRDVRPTFFGAVPRIWLKFKEGVEAHLAKAARTIETDEDKAYVRQMLGLDATRMNITGSAPIAPAVHEWYQGIGLQLRESYGMTETFAHGTVWDSTEPCIPGCVGRPAAGLDMRLTDAGEIEFKTPSLMKGYYENEEKTTEVIHDGWLATGDLGRIDADGNLWVTGRVGSIFKTSKGKFVNPERVERELYKDDWIEQVIVFGHGLAQPVAVVSFAEVTVLSSEQELFAHFSAVVERVNDALPTHENLGALLVVRDVWSVDGGQLTPTLKIKRKALIDQYSARIERLKGVVVQ